MINRPKAIEDYDGLCFKCLEKKEVNTYILGHRGYGSTFDSMDSQVQLCSECEPERISEWFYEVPKYEKYCEEYQLENKIREFIATLPIESQELFWCRCSSGAMADYMESQDWIDFHLGVLPEWKCKEYHMYSPYRLKVARERFELCNEPVNKIYSDGSKSCWCPFGAHGEYNQKAGPNTGDDCYECDMFCMRYEQIKEVVDKKYAKYAEIERAKATLAQNPDYEDGGE